MRQIKLQTGKDLSRQALTGILGIFMLSAHGAVNADTALKNNAVASNSSFSNFDGINLTIDVPAYPMNGQYRFLKIYDAAGKVLFLGAISADEAFVIPVQKLKAVNNLTMELFTESASDQTLTLSAEINP